MVDLNEKAAYGYIRRSPVENIFQKKKKNYVLKGEF